MSNIIEIVEAAIADANHGDEGSAAIKAFLEAAAEQGWHMRPDEPTVKMLQAALTRMVYEKEPIRRSYRAMNAAAPPFKWDE